MEGSVFINESFRFQRILLSGSDGYPSMVNCKPCPLYYAVVEQWGGGSLSVAAADSTAAGGRLTARPLHNHMYKFTQREEGGGGGVIRLRERETGGERLKRLWGRERGTENGRESVKNPK